MGLRGMGSPSVSPAPLRISFNAALLREIPSRSANWLSLGAKCVVKASYG